MLYSNYIVWQQQKASISIIDSSELAVYFFASNFKSEKLTL